jgi:hypothetical protein
LYKVLPERKLSYWCVYFKTRHLAAVFVTYP